MNKELELDDRLRLALHDLDDRANAHVRAKAQVRARAQHSDPAPVVGRGGHRRGRLVPAMAGLAVLAMLVGVGWLVRPGGSAQLSPSARQDEVAPSQSPEDAARDHVLPEIAALPLTERLAPIAPLHPGASTRVSGPEGTWLISSPDVSSIEGTCPDPPSTTIGGVTQQRIGCVGYSEILLMTPDLKRVIRAFPLAKEPAQWLQLTPDAIYCGRHGHGNQVEAVDQSDSMVCRIDRSTPRLTGRIFPDADPGAGPAYLQAELPGSWTTNEPSTQTGFDQVSLGDGALQVLDWQGKPTIRLDPLTLKPLGQ